MGRLDGADHHCAVGGDGMGDIKLTETALWPKLQEFSRQMDMARPKEDVAPARRETPVCPKCGQFVGCAAH